MSSPLKPCPFCAGDPHTAVDRGVYRVVCGSCGAQSDEASSAVEAHRLWNRRETKEVAQ